MKDNEQSEEKQKKESEESPDGFFSRFKKEFMKDLETDDKNKETINEFRRKSAQFQAQYDKYVGSHLPKSMPAWPRKSVKDEPDENQAERISMRERAESLKSRLNKERLHEDYNNLTEFVKAKSQTSYDKMRQWREKSEQTEVQDGEEILKPSKPNIIQSKFKAMYEKSGIAENPLYQKARDHSMSVLNVSIVFIL
jgi:hypothetical protein